MRGLTHQYNMGTEAIGNPRQGSLSQLYHFAYGTAGVGRRDLLRNRERGGGGGGSSRLERTPSAQI